MDVASREDAINNAIAFVAKVVHFTYTFARGNLASGWYKLANCNFHFYRDHTSYVKVVAISNGCFPMPYFMFLNGVFTNGDVNDNERLSII